jgi:hypothetical protein
MGVPHLPLELVEEIIDLLVGDTKSLHSCSLVSTSWIHRSRRHLFADIKLHSLSDLKSWFSAGLGPSSDHVRALDLAQNDEVQWITPDSLAGAFNDFSSFHNVRSLALTGLDLTLFDEHSLTRFFGHFSEHLISLSVKGMTVHPDALLFFVCMFPRLDNLKLDYLMMGMGKGTISYREPAITPRFRGKLALANIKSHGASMISPFVDSPLPMAFEDVSVVDCRFDTPKPLKDLFVACQATMKKIKVSKIFLGEFPLHGSSHSHLVSPESHAFGAPQTTSHKHRSLIYPRARAWKRCDSVSFNFNNQATGSNQFSKPSPPLAFGRSHSRRISPRQPHTSIPESTFRAGPG